MVRLRVVRLRVFVRVFVSGGSSSGGSSSGGSSSGGSSSGGSSSSSEETSDLIRRLQVLTPCHHQL